MTKFYFFLRLLVGRMYVFVVLIPLFIYSSRVRVTLQRTGKVDGNSAIIILFYTCIQKTCKTIIVGIDYGVKD